MIITAGIYKGRKITAPDENITRPTLSKVRMGVFNTLYSILGDFEGKSFLDVFGGSGVMGLEALSRGFEGVTVFEKNRKAAEIIRKNYNQLGLKPDLKIGDTSKLITRLDKVYDVVYIDPPYMSNLYESILKNVTGGIIVVEGIKDIGFEGLELIKTKNYGDKSINYLKNISFLDRKSTRLNSSHTLASRMPSSA